MKDDDGDSRLLDIGQGNGRILILGESEHGTYQTTYHLTYLEARNLAYNIQAILNRVGFR